MVKKDITRTSQYEKEMKRKKRKKKKNRPGEMDKKMILTCGIFPIPTDPLLKEHKALGCERVWVLCANVVYLIYRKIHLSSQLYRTAKHIIL